MSVPTVTINAKAPSAGVDKYGNEKEMIKYENNLGVCPSPDSRHIGVTSQQITSVTKTSYCKIETASLNNYYNHDDIRAVHIDKAPWNDQYFMMTVLGFIVMLYGFTDGFKDEEETKKKDYKPSDLNTYLGVVGLVLFLIFLAKLVYQYMRPKVFVSVDTARYGGTACSWSNLSETLVFIGKGPGVDVLSEDDVGKGILSLLEQETVLQRHEGRKIKGEMTEIIITDKRLSVRRSKRCCCNLILRQDYLSSYKLEEVASTTADQSFPLWWILATIWTVGCILGHVLECSEENEGVEGAPCYDPKKKEDFNTMMIIFYVLAVIFFSLAANMPGGVGYCRRAFVTIFFKGPLYVPFFFLNQFEVIELPKGVAQGRADTIAKSVMAAKDRKAKSKNYA